MERSDLTKKDVKTIVVFQFCTETYIYICIIVESVMDIVLPQFAVIGFWFPHTT